MQTNYAISKTICPFQISKGLNKNYMLASNPHVNLKVVLTLESDIVLAHHAGY